ncbi:MAG: TIM barrel protein [Verrucomicrobia bacterium]|nr:TIM barrel protein [Verrucomicrobiota bacterium]
MHRRSFLMTAGKSAAITAVATSLATRLHAADAAVPGTRINHSACKWCYGDIPLEALCVAGKALGLKSIELLMPGDFPTLQSHGLTCAMVANPVGKTASGVPVGTIAKAFNRLDHHDALVAAYEPHLKAAAAAGASNVICFSGNREGLADQQGLENCAIGLQRLLPLAANLGLKLVMELLNSKVDHADYMCDHSAWGVALCKKLDNPHFGLLYDIYHMQIMEGDVIHTIREHHRWFTHYHTGGVPGRNEIDDTQELNYPAIMRAIADTGYSGFVGQEFIPKRPDKLASLKQGLEICSV